MRQLRQHPKYQHCKYKDEYVHQAHVACAEGGLTNAQLAKLFKVTQKTINYWIQHKPEFADAVRAGRDVYDSANVEKSLLRRAIGYTYYETTQEPVTDPESGEKKLQVTKRVKKHVTPDVAAQRYWLNNRQPGRWKNVKHVEMSGEGGGPLEHKVEYTKDPVQRMFDDLAKSDGEGEQDAGTEV